jgi:hypothetical protein
MTTRLEQLYGKKYNLPGGQDKTNEFAPEPPRGTLRNTPLKNNPDRSEANSAWANLHNKLGKLPPLGNRNYDDTRVGVVIDDMYPGRVARDESVEYEAGDPLGVQPDDGWTYKDIKPVPTLEPGYLREIIRGQGLPADYVKSVSTSLTPPPGVSKTAAASWNDGTRSMWYTSDPGQKKWVAAFLAHEISHGQAHEKSPWFVPDPRGNNNAKTMFDDFSQQVGHFPPGIPGDRGRADMLEAQNNLRKFGGQYPKWILDMYPQLKGQDPSRVVNFRNPTGKSPWKTSPLNRGKNNE